MNNMIGSNIRVLRRSRGWDQKKLANLLGVSRSIISKYENGSTDLDSNKILLIRNIFEVDADDLMTIDFEKEGIKLLSKKNIEKTRDRMLDNLLDQINQLKNDKSVSDEKLLKIMAKLKAEFPKIYKTLNLD